MHPKTREALQAKIFAQIHAVHLARPVRFTEAEPDQHLTDALLRAQKLYKSRAMGTPMPVPVSFGAP
eukprot:5878019-Alexandrium_andersonii.AAC.1